MWWMCTILVLKRETLTLFIKGLQVDMQRRNDVAQGWYTQVKVSWFIIGSNPVNDSRLMKVLVQN